MDSKCSEEGEASTSIMGATLSSPTGGSAEAEEDEPDMTVNSGSGMTKGEHAHTHKQELADQPLQVWAGQQGEDMINEDNQRFRWSVTHRLALLRVRRWRMIGIIEARRIQSHYYSPVNIY